MLQNLKRQIAPITLVLAAILLFSVKQHNAYVTLFDFSAVFLLVLGVSLVIVLLYKTIICDLPVRQTLDLVRKLLQIDPSERLMNFLRCDTQLDSSEMISRLKQLDASNTKKIFSSPLGSFIVICALIAGLGLLLHAIKNLREGLPAFKTIEVLIILVIGVAACFPILVFYSLVYQYKYNQNANFFMQVLTDLQSNLGKKLITIWNQDKNLRSNIDPREDASDVLKDYLPYLMDVDDAISQIRMAVRSGDRSSATQTSSTIHSSDILRLCDQLKSAVDGLTKEIKNFDPNNICSVDTDSNFDQDSGDVLPSLSNFAQVTSSLVKLNAELASGLGAGNSTSNEAVILDRMENCSSSAGQIMNKLQHFTLQDYCNRREKVRGILRYLQTKISCDAAGGKENFEHSQSEMETRPNDLNVSISKNMNGFLILIIGISVMVLYSNSTINASLMWEPSAVCASVILFLIFLWGCRQHLKTGRFKTMIDLPDYRYFTYLLMSNSDSPHSKINQLPKTDCVI